MAVEDLTHVNVAGNALVEFIERVAVAGGRDIQVGQGDKGWYVTYKPPFTREVKEDSKHACSPQQIAEADCEGDIAKCGGVCYDRKTKAFIL